jgi:hypothetical protein
LFLISGYPKISLKIEKNILNKMSLKKTTITNSLFRSTVHKVRYTRKLQYFIQFFEEPPIIYDENRKIVQPSELKEIDFNSQEFKEIALSVLNSSLFFWFFIAFSDCRNVNTREILKFPIELDEMDCSIIHRLKETSKELMENFQENSIFQHRNDKRAGRLEIQSFQPRESKDIIDRIDIILAEHYRFTNEELDFIINYDIKYRMGKELEEEED